MSFIDAQTSKGADPKKAAAAWEKGEARHGNNTAKVKEFALNLLWKFGPGGQTPR